MSKSFKDKMEEYDNPGVSVPEIGFGRIQTSIFAYLTPLMLIIGTAVVTIIALSFDKLYIYFETNVALNGLIIGLMTIGMFGAFNNNFALYRVAKFLDELENARAKAKVPPAQVVAFQKKMATVAPILDTQNMYKAISNLESFGHYNFSDTDARLIKSKVGYRISGKKSDVGFISGILVMLGLLGTFLGLLGTIDAVGAALGGMATMDVTKEGAMGEFIASLAAPLQGMGLAFSSSLFGLSGSLMIGFFNFLCGGAQNNFIENFSRWIDNRIPRQVGGDGKGGGKGGAGSNVPNALSFDDELKNWLSGYVALTVETNKQLKMLAQTLNDTLDGFGRGEMILEQISAKQDTQIKHAATTNTSLATQQNLISKGNETLVSIDRHATNHATEMNAKLYPFIVKFQDSMNGLTNLMLEHTKALDSGLSSIEQTLQMTHYQSQDNLDNISERVFNMSTIAEKSYESMLQRVGAINTLLKELDQKNEDLPSLPAKLDQHLIGIASILETSQKNSKDLFTLFKEVNGPSGPAAKMLFKIEKSMLAMNKKMFETTKLGKGLKSRAAPDLSAFEDSLTDQEKD